MNLADCMHLSHGSGHRCNRILDWPLGNETARHASKQRPTLGIREVFRMKRLVSMALLAMALPVAAFADSSLIFQNLGGTLTQSSSGVTLSKSKLTMISGLNGGGPITSTNPIVKVLGMLDFSTGAEISSSFNASTNTTTTRFAGGGSFTIIGNGQDGVPKGVLFQGTFSGPVTVTRVGRTRTNASSWMLSGTITGIYNGISISAKTVQLRVGGGMVSGSSTLGTVPEPGTLGLLGTGLLGIAGLVRRKSKAKQASLREVRPPQLKILF
jgi:hypothetical protein